MFEYKDWVVETVGNTTFIFNVESLVFLEFATPVDALRFINSQ